MKSDVCIPMSYSKKNPNGLNLIISRRFDDLDCWDFIEVLKVFKKELFARRNRKLIYLQFCPY